jgi:hypothetical protein
MLKHHPITRAGLALALAGALAAPVGAGAQDLRSPDARDAATPQDLRSPDARDAATRAPVGHEPIPAPRIVRVTPDQFDRGDAGIGAGGTIGPLLIATGAGMALVRRRAGRREVDIAA